MKRFSVHAYRSRDTQGSKDYNSNFGQAMTRPRPIARHRGLPSQTGATAAAAGIRVMADTELPKAIKLFFGCPKFHK